MYYAKWMEKLAKMDTKLTRAQRHKEFWYILEISGIHMSWDPQYYVWNLVYVAFLFAVLSYYVPCLIVSMFKVDDLAEMGQYLNFMSLILISQAMIIVANVKRKNIITLLSMNAQGFYDYGDTFDMGEIVELKKLFEFLKNVLLVVLPIWLILIAGSVMVSDYVDAIFAFDTTVTSDFVNGVYQHLPLKMWYFHTIDSQFKRYLFILSEIICSSEMAMAITSADLCLIFFGQTLIIQMKTLVVAIQATDSRADLHYKTTTGNDPPKDAISRRLNRELMKSYRACLKQNMEHHKTILFYFDLYRDFINWPSGVSVLNGAILVAMSAISLMQGGGQPSLILTSILLIIAEIASLFLLCEIGQTIKDLGEESFHAMYQFRWRNCSKDVITDMRLMRVKMGKPLVMIGILTPLNRDTFATLLNTAYSYMSLLRASDRKAEQLNE